MYIEIQSYIVVLKNHATYFIEKCISKTDEEKWKITLGPYNLDKNLNLIYEPLPSDKHEIFLKNTRFSLDEAKSILLRLESKDTCDCRAIGKNGNSCDGSYYSCEKCKES